MGSRKLCIICCYSYVDVKEEILCAEEPTTTERANFQSDEILDLLNQETVDILGSGGYQSDKHHRLKLFCEELQSLRFTRSKNENDDNSDSGFKPEGFFLALESFQQVVSLCPDCVASISTAMTTKGRIKEVEFRVNQLQLKLLTELKELRRQVERFFVEVEKIDTLVKISDFSCLENCLGKANPSNPHADGRGLIIFRERVSDLAEELRFYQSGLQNRIELNRSTCLNYTGSVKKTSVSTSQVKNTPVASGKRKGRATLGTKTQRFRETKINKIEIEDDDQFYGDGNEIQSVSPPRIQEEADYNANDEFILPEDAYDSDNVDNDDDDEDFEENLRRKSKNNSTKIKAKKRKSDTDAVPKKRHGKTYKERLISQVSRKARNSKKLKELAPDYLKDDPIYNYCMEYNEETDIFTLGGIQIIVLENEGTLECSLCQYRPNMTTTAKRCENYVVRYMYSHILGKHLGAFRCKVCGEEMVSHWRFREHLKSHQSQFICDICDKPCKAKAALLYHRWLHLNEEEKLEAIRNGEKNPREYQEKLRNVSEKMFQCAKCGKNFKTKHDLRQHEERHKNENKKITCPQCGKLFKRSSFDTYHRRYGCDGRQDKHRVECPKCNVSLKNKVFLRRHMARLHSEAAKERPFLCQICGKGYKSGGDLQVHSKIHAEERLLCQGCGKSFNTKRNVRRHEKTCRAISN